MTHVYHPTVVVPGDLAAPGLLAALAPTLVDLVQWPLSPDHSDLPSLSDSLLHYPLVEHLYWFLCRARKS